MALITPSEPRIRHDPPDRLQMGMSLVGFVGSLLVWKQIFASILPSRWGVVIAWGAPGIVVFVAWLGRTALNRARTLRTVARITAVVHFFLMTLLGSAAIAAFKLASGVWWGRFSFPLAPGRVLFWITGFALMFTVLNLALRAFGAPFAIVLSGRLTTEWSYSYTRNPMVLCLFGFLVAVACRLGSTLFLLWIATAAFPVMLWYLRIYEERELELRFGASYLEYRQRVPMLWPRWPGKD